MPVPAAVVDVQPDTSADDLLKVVAELDRTDPDWRLEQIEAKRKAFPDDQNGAMQIKAFRMSVTEKSGLPRNPGVWWSQGFRGRLEAIQKEPPTTRLTDADGAVLRAELKRFGPALTEAQKMIAYPHGRFTVVQKRDAVSTLLPDHQVGRDITRSCSKSMPW
jgi:hypothetical protein